MYELILVLVLLAVSVVILFGVAFYRGWFRLAVIPAHDKLQFVLMRKKEKAPEGKYIDNAQTENPQSPEPRNIAPPEPLAEKDGKDRNGR